MPRTSNPETALGAESTRRRRPARAAALRTAVKPATRSSPAKGAPPARPSAAAAAVPPSPAKKGARVAATPEREAAPVRRRRSNRRSEQSIENILACTEEIILESGATRISILDVCRAAGVARGTFYRYFASQEELLDAFSRHKRERFHRSLIEATQHVTEPDARFQAVIEHLDSYLQHSNARRLLQVAPEYALSFFKRIFHDSVVRFQDVLSIVFDAWEARLGVQLDRELVCELLIRYVLSELLVPSEGERKAVPRRIGRMVGALVLGAPVRARR